MFWLNDPKFEPKYIIILQHIKLKFWVKGHARP